MPKDEETVVPLPRKGHPNLDVMTIEDDSDINFSYTAEVSTLYLQTDHGHIALLMHPWQVTQLFRTIEEALRGY